MYFNSIALAFPHLDHQQRCLIDKLQLYMNKKCEKIEQKIDATEDFNEQLRLIQELSECKLPFNSLNGLCSGLVAFWLYFKRNNEEGKFISRIEYVLTWNPETFASGDKNEDPLLEEILNNFGFLQHVKDLLLGVNQDNLVASFDFLAGKHHPKVYAEQFSITHVFNRNTLNNLIAVAVQQNKMVRLDNAMHTVGLMQSGDKYYFYNPDCVSGPVEYSSLEVEKLVEDIFSGLGKYCKSEEFLALYLTIFDIEGSPKGQYPDKIIYSKSLLNNNIYKQAVLSHKNIFNLCMRYSQFETLDLLFNEGYSYIPTISDYTEYEEAIVYQDYTKMDYLLRRNIPLNYRTEKGYTPLGRAINQMQTKMIFLLIIAGADPNISANKEKSLLSLATSKNNIEAIIMLLAAGLKITPDVLSLLKQKLPAEQLELVIKHALLLNEKLLNLSTGVNIDDLTSKKLAKLLVHDTLSIELEQPNKINELLTEVITKITAKQIKDYSKEELVDLEIIIETITDLSENVAAFNKEAKQALDAINKYLTENQYKFQQQTPYQASRLLFTAPEIIGNEEAVYHNEIEPLLPKKLTIN